MPLNDPPLALKCPACSSSECVRGNLLASDNGDSHFHGYFYPDRMRFFSFWRSVETQDGTVFSACAQCGCVWSKLNVVQLQRVLAGRAPPPSRYMKYLKWLAKLVMLAGLISLVVFVIVVSTGP
jgi:hypothetical protein